MSRTHANRGQGFERVLADLHAIYERQGRASVIRTPPAMRILRAAGGPGQFVCVFDGEGPPDLFVMAGGVAIVADAKDCASDRWALEHLPKHQADRFDAHERQGGTAGVILRMAGAVWWLPWVAVGPLWWEHAGKVGRAARGTASLSVADCDRIGLRCRGADWLPMALSAITSLGGSNP